MPDEVETAEIGWEVVPDTDASGQTTQTVETGTETEVKAEDKKQGDEFGRRAEKRIRDLVKRAKAAEDAAAAAQANASRWESDLGALRTEVQSLKQGSQINTKDAIQQRYAAAKTNLLRAKEAGDSAAEVAAIEAMTAAQADWRFASTVKPEEVKKPEERPVRSGADGLHPKAQRWIDSQEWWSSDDLARGAAIALAGKLEKEGYDPTDDEHYAELSKRLAKKFPEHFGSAEEDDGEEVVQSTRARPRQVVASGSRVAEGSGSRQKVKLTEGQVRMAEKMGVPIEVYARNLAKMDAAKRPDGSYGAMEIEIPVGGKVAMTDDVAEESITRRVRKGPAGKRQVREEQLMLAPAEEDNLKLPEEAENDERFVYRWVRVMLALPQGGYEDDIKNILKREREGWVFVKPEDLPGSYSMPVRVTGNVKGVVGVDDVALMKLPREIADARRRWQEKKAADLMQAVNRQLYRENDPRMPIFNESKTQVRTGRNAEFDS